MQVPLPLCLSDCIHFHHANQRGATCAAFPSGIPEPILASEVLHDDPYPGDRGIRFASPNGETAAQLFGPEAEDEKPAS